MPLATQPNRTMLNNAQQHGLGGVVIQDLWNNLFHCRFGFHREASSTQK